MGLEPIIKMTTYIFYVILLVSAVFCIDKVVYIFAAFFPGKKFPEAKRNGKYAILVPARNESKVIASLLKSIRAQTYPADLIDIFVVVEDENDPTCEICKEFGARVTVRKHLELKGKGYALDELLNDMYEHGYKDKYDAYFIFDADNVLTPTYMAEMNKVYNCGYHIALGYRNSKNWNDGWVASSSALTFSMLNTFHNKFNARIGGEMILSGTGFFIDARIIDNLGGWKFYCLTEDVELSYFSALNNLKTTYCDEAEFYDEQPTKFKVSSKQRLRWLKGYLQASKKYQKNIIKSAIKEKEGRARKISHLTFVLPIIIAAVDVALYIITMLGLGTYGYIVGEPNFMMAFGKCLLWIGLTYLALMLFNALLLLSESKKINITRWNAIKTVIMGPIFLFWYLPIFVKSLFAKEVSWDQIDHKINMTFDETGSEAQDISVESAAGMDGEDIVHLDDNVVHLTDNVVHLTDDQLPHTGS